MNNNNNYSTPPLFDEFPRLEKKLPWMSMGNFPTPVQESPGLAEAAGVGRMFIKRDDLTHDVYGGNKVRKLEFILADARRRGAVKLITFGGIGSNHALATTIHGAALGMKTVSCLVPQPVTPHVKKNMLVGLHYEEEIVVGNKQHDIAASAIRKLAEYLFKDGKLPYVVPPGGTSALGAIGYINAAFELKRQINEGVLLEPDRIYVAVGTCGTAGGLTAGCRAAGLKSKVIGVKVTDMVFGNPVSFAAVATHAALKLHVLDRSFPAVVISPLDVNLLMDYFGEEYGKYTREGLEAVELMKERADVKLEGVYTGKAFAGLLGDARDGSMKDMNVLFWNTYNSADLSDIAAGHDYHELPEELHKYFEMEEHEIGRE